MGNPAGVKLDFEALDKRRLKAISFLEKSDWNQSDVARRFQVAANGEPAVGPVTGPWPGIFRKSRACGPQPERTEADQERLQELLLQGPEKRACARVSHRIDKEFGVEYRPALRKNLDDNPAR